jgi:poly(hydroxyalkanoate) depolymerase family esterase
MNDRMQAGMAEATRLTLAGRLAEATATIQRTLGSATGINVSPAGPDNASAPIEAEFRVVEDSPPSAEKSKRSSVRTDSAKVRPATPLDVLTSGALKLHGVKYRVQEPMQSVAPEVVPSSARTGGRFVDGVYTNSAGTRAYKLYIPSGYTGQALPLVVMLHGCTQTSIDFAAGTRMNVLAEKEIFLVAYPEQVNSANGSRCWNWFQAANQGRGAGEPSLIAGITQQIMSSHHVDISRVYVAGLSAGGAMAVIMAATYPDLFAAVGVHSGLAYGGADDLPTAYAAMKQGPAKRARNLTQAIPMIVFHGDSDKTVAKINADHLLDQWLRVAVNRPGAMPRSSRDATVEHGQGIHGHAYTRYIYHDVSGRAIAEKWVIHQAGHAWSGGSPNGSFTDPKGPDASAEMFRFFMEHP